MEMKYNYFKLSLAAILIGISLGNCTKDKGNYDYTDVNQVEVSLTDSVFEIEQMKELHVRPSLKESIPSAGDSYTYAWHVYPKNNIGVGTSGITTESEVILLSEEKDLKTIINFTPLDYYLQYTITSTKTGVKTIKRYPLKVNGAFYEGWLVMNNVAGAAQLSFIRKDNEVFMNPLNTVHGKQMEGKGLASYSGIINLMSQITAFTDKGAYRFNADDFSIQVQNDKLFLEMPSFEAPYYSVNHINTDQYIVAGGKVYGTIAPNFGLPGKYSTPFGGVDYAAFSYFFSGNKFYSSFYDNKHKRFLQTSYNSRVLNTYSSIVDAAYDLTSVGKTMIVADLGMGNEYYTVMKDETGYFYYGYNPSLASPATRQQPMLNSPEIASAAAFAASSSLQHLYYATGNNVYLYDIMANAARLVYSFPAGKQIKDLKMYKSKGWGNFKDPMFNKRLVVATSDGTNGEVYYLDLLPTGDIQNNSYEKVFTGFGDIVQLNYRNPNE